MTRRLLIAGNLNWPTLRGDKPTAFERLLTQQQRTEFVAGLHTTALYKDGDEKNTRTRVASFVSANGLRAGSGFTVGILGAAVGIHWSLGLSSMALCLGTLAAGIYALRYHPAAAEAQAPTPVTPASPVPDRKA
jgi:hypothetical protein